MQRISTFVFKKLNKNEFHMKISALDILKSSFVSSLKFETHIWGCYNILYILGILIALLVNILFITLK